MRKIFKYLFNIQYQRREKNIDRLSFKSVIPKIIAKNLLKSFLLFFLFFFWKLYITLFVILMLLYYSFDFFVLSTLFIIYSKDNITNNVDTELINKSFLIFNMTKEDTEYDLKKRYRELSKQWHPDKFVNDIIENQEIAKRNFQKVNNAYNIIKKYKGMI